MTKHEREEILCHVAQEFISPLFHEGQKMTAEEIWLEWSGNKFNELCEFVSQFVTEDESSEKK